MLYFGKIKYYFFRVVESRHFFLRLSIELMSIKFIFELFSHNIWLHDNILFHIFVAILFVSIKFQTNSILEIHIFQDLKKTRNHYCFSLVLSLALCL